MKILIVGAGGREHAIADTVSKSKHVDEVFICPSNTGINATAVHIPVTEIHQLADFVQENKIDMTIVGPEVPLVLGIADLFEAKGLKIIGVNQACAEFEGSKNFTKEFLMKYNIPTAQYVKHTDFAKAVDDIGIYGFPMVIKADGLAAGKGVIIAETEAEAKTALDDIMVKKVFGDTPVVIEEFLTGTEASIICFVDGKTIVPLETAQDYKKVFNDDKGPNTGGMGSYSPSFVIDETLQKTIYDTILQPTMDGFISENLDYKGILFVGIMIDDTELRVPKVLEFNVRFGDPETQPILSRLETDLVDIFQAIIDGNLANTPIAWSDESAVCVVLTSGGYPDQYPTKLPITIEVDDRVTVYHAGTTMVDGQLVTNGGRVLNVLAKHKDIEVARAMVYENVDKIHFEKKQFRTDIAVRK
ncbi:MAG: phosphoribosylamine--glycine ligase [Bacillota bacterium]